MIKTKITIKHHIFPKIIKIILWSAVIIAFLMVGDAILWQVQTANEARTTYARINRDLGYILPEHMEVLETYYSSFSAQFDITRDIVLEYSFNQTDYEQLITKIQQCPWEKISDGYYTRSVFPKNEPIYHLFLHDQKLLYVIYVL